MNILTVGNKPTLESITVLAGAVYVLIGYLQGQGILPEGTSSAASALGVAITDAIQAVVGIFGIWGARRAIGSK